jgi:sec-independent protein translocase protein TatA
MEYMLFGFFGGIGVAELLVIFVIILLLFGAKRLPEIARSLGEGIKEFKKSVKDVSDTPSSNDTSDQSEHKG